MIIGESSDGNEAVMFIHDAKPDILVVDITTSNRSGAGLLKYLKVMMPDYRPLTYVMTGNDTIESESTAREFHVDCYSLKPINPDHVISNIKKLLAVKEREHAVIKIEEKRRSDLLPGILRQLGVPIHLTSTKRTMELLYLYIEKYEKGITGQELYGILAKRLGTTSGAIERGVRSTISYMIKADSPLFRQIFHYELDTDITNMMFLSMLGLYVDTEA